jgi:hypothetical protein
MERKTLFIYKRICLICTHLVGKELGTKTKACSFKKGNLKCPAHLVNIELGVDTDLAIENFYLAVQNGDPTAMIAALTEAQSNPKISLAVISDLQERLFEISTATDGAGETGEVSSEHASDSEGATIADNLKLTKEEPAEDEDEDEDVDA